METIFYYIIVPLVILGIAINIHEFGHYIVGRIFGMRIEAYSFFGIGKLIWKYDRGAFPRTAEVLTALLETYFDPAEVRHFEVTEPCLLFAGKQR